MPAYQYAAKDQSGKSVSGHIEAEDEHNAARVLRARGLWPMRIQPAVRAHAGRPAARATQAGPMPSDRAPSPGSGPETASPAPRRGQGRFGVSLKGLAIFFRQLSVGVASGMPMVRCMDVMREQSRGVLARVSAEARSAVSQGLPLSSVFCRYPRIFSPLVLAMVRAGEKGGLLDRTLDQTADMLEAQYELIQEIRRQMFYPKFLLAAAVLVIMGSSLVQADLAGRGMLQALRAGSSAELVQNAVHLVVLAAGCVVVVKLWGHTRLMDQVKLAIPMIGGIFRKLATARFCSALAALYRAGLPVPEALGAAADACGNQVMADDLRRAIPVVQQGGSLSVALASTHVLPPMGMNMLVSGEESGSVDEMLDKVAMYASAEGQTAVKQIAAAAPLVAFLIVAVIIGSQIVGTYQGVIGQVEGVANSLER